MKITKYMFFFWQYVFLVATLMNSLGAILSPVFSNLDFAALIAIRIMQGLGGVSLLSPSSLAGAHSLPPGSCSVPEG